MHYKHDCMSVHELACSSFLCLSSSQEFRSACFHLFKLLVVLVVGGGGCWWVVVDDGVGWWGCGYCPRGKRVSPLALHFGLQDLAWQYYSGENTSSWLHWNAHWNRILLWFHCSSYRELFRGYNTLINVINVINLIDVIYIINRINTVCFFSGVLRNKAVVSFFW